MNEISCKPARVTEEIYGNIWFRQMIFDKKGHYKVGHKHEFDHVTFVTNGSIEAFELHYDNNGHETERSSLGIFSAPAYIKVPKDKSHTIIALEDESAVYCVQAVRDGDEIITTNFADENWKEPELTKL